jgi:hypothetical protein
MFGNVDRFSLSRIQLWIAGIEDDTAVRPRDGQQRSPLQRFDCGPRCASKLVAVGIAEETSGPTSVCGATHEFFPEAEMNTTGDGPLRSSSGESARSNYCALWSSNTFSEFFDEISARLFAC